ncbi:T9SS type A sorting domain-containing protein [candidate division KSB1 bacterium]|nr:T9SS type A sorting domain-containing protein [candidate division KSB1 bacterium]
MKSAIVILLALLLSMFSRPANAWINISLCEIDEALHCPCGTEGPLIGHTTAYVMQDVNLNGPDALDDTYAAVEYCQYIAEGCSCAWLPFGPVPDGPLMFYVRVAGSDSCCWISDEFPLANGYNHIELSGWECVPARCFARPFNTMAAWFTDCMQSVGCPCDYPLQLPLGTPICLWHDLDSNEVSDADTVVACFEFGAGAGRPPWNCQWTPAPDRMLSPGYYYLLINSGACCWVAGSYLSSNGGGTMAVTPGAWQCYDIPCAQAQPPASPSSVTVDCDTVLVAIRFVHDGYDVSGYHAYRNGEFFASFPSPAMFPFYDWQSVPGVVNTYCVSAYNHFGESALTCAPPCTVQFEPPSPNVIARPMPAMIPECVIAPNPFNPETAITLTLPMEMTATLAIYDVQGRLVTILADGALSAGQHRFSFNGAHLPSGLYFARLQTPESLTTHKLLLLK